MDNRWQIFFEKFPETVTCEQLPVKLPRFDLELCELAGAAADWCHQYLKDRKCPSDLMVYLTKTVINNLRVQWAAEPKLFGYRPDKKDYQALWLMQRVIGELNEVCLNPGTIISYHQPILTSIWWSSFVLKNSRRQMEDYIAVIPYLHTLFDMEDYSEASFYAVYDGHNGLDAAVYSSMYLHQYLVQSTYYLTDPKYALFEAFYATDKGFTQKTEKYNLVSGTTAVCALHRPHEKKLHIGWVGDSIATLWKNGTSLCLVNKHVPERHDETERIKNNGGMVSKCQGTWRVDGQLAVSRAIGDVKYKPHIICEPEIRTLVLDGNEEFLVLCSDGLWGHTTPEDVAETIYDELLETDGDASEVGNKLAFKSKAQGSTDNISVVIVFLQDPKLLVAKRRAVIMETAMEQRNATATLASYGQDTGDFGPETDVDTPDEPTGLSKPKVEGEANVIDESGEDSEEDGSGWNYYKKSTENIKEKSNIENDNITGNNSDTEDMDYKLNPDAPEFVPVSSPPLPMANHAQRFVEMDNDDFISSSPQKFKESIDNVDLPNENDFTNEIKVHAADLSKLDNKYEPSDDCTALNDIKPLKEEIISHDENVENFLHRNDEHTSNENIDTLKNPFTSNANVDLDKVQDLSEYQIDNAQTHSTDPYASIIEMPKTNEFCLTSDDNICQNESNTKLNDDFSIGKHIKYEQDMNLKNIDDTINTTNATVGSTSQLDDESFKHSDDFKNEFMENNHIKFSLYEDRKLNDSVSTTDAILGSEPNTPMRMDNQSTFESENDDDQFSESFKQQLQFNQFDEQNNKENHDPFCFTEDPAGIIPNVTREENKINEPHQTENNVNPNDNSSNEHVSKLTTRVPVEEPLCIKEEAKPFHSVYEQQDLPESDFSASTHEALLNTTESEYNHLDNSISTEHAEQQNIVENHIKNNEECIEHIKVETLKQEFTVPSHVPDDIELDDSDVDEVKDHVEGLKQEFYHDNTSNFEQDNSSTIYNENESIVLEHNTANDIPQYFEDIKQEHFDVEKVTNDYKDSKQDYHFDTATIQNNDGEFEQEFHNDVAAKVNILEGSQQNDQFYVETVQNHVDNVVEAVQSHIEDFEQEHHNILQVENNYVDDFKHDNVAEFKNYNEDFKQTSDNFTGTTEIHNEDLQQEHYNIESVQNHVADSDEEMHSSMIIHADIENNMPQPYCSAHDALMNEPDMMCTSMTFEENFQNRNMSDSLYVMETSSDYFGDDVQQTIQLDKPVDGPKVDEQILNVEDVPVESSTQIENEIITETQSELVGESNQLLSQNLTESVNKQEENNKVPEVAIAAAVGTVAIAAAAGVALASKKSTPKKVETTISKAKTTTKTTPTKPLVSKTTTSTVKKTTLSTTSKPLSRPTTAPSTSKPTTNVRPTIAPKTTITLKATTVTKTAPKPTPKTTVPASRLTSAKTTPTTPRVTSLTKTTPTLSKTSPTSPKTPTTSKTTTATKSATTPKTSTTQRTSLVSKQSLTTDSPKPLSRPISAPAKKTLSSSTHINGTSKLTNGTTKLTNGTTKLTNGDVSKTSTTAKPPVSLATRMSLAPPKLPPKTKVAPKTVIPPPMPGPIRRPKAPTTKKTETATS